MPGIEAHEVAGEERELSGPERTLVVAAEVVVVLRLRVVAGDLELGDRDRLHELGHRRKALPERGERGVDLAELVAVRRRAADETLPAEDPEDIVDAAPPLRGERALPRRGSEELRHDVEIEQLGVARADAGPERVGVPSGLRPQVVGAHEVGELHDERVDGAP